MICSSLVACGRSPAEIAAAGPAGLRINLLQAGRLELFVAPGVLRASVERAAREIEATAELSVRVRGLQELNDVDGEPGAARTLIGTWSELQDLPVIQSLGLDSCTDAEGRAGFAWCGRQFGDPGDGLIATLADPRRPGLPLSLYLGNDADQLAGYLGDLRPAWRPSLRILRSGWVELECRLASSGILTPGSLRDYSERARRFRQGYRRLPLEIASIEVFAPFDIDQERLVAYLELLGRVRARLEEWAAPEPGRELGLDLILHIHPEEMADLAGADRLFDFNPVDGSAHALLAPELPDDSGAGFALGFLNAVLGPAAQYWIETAAALDAANVFWGQDLELWVARLHSGQLIPDLESLLELGADTRCSPLVLEPSRAMFLRYLRDKRGAGYLHSLWTGAVELVPDAALAADFESYLAALSAERRAELQARREARRAGHLQGASGLPFKKGVVLLGDEQNRRGFGSRMAQLSLERVLQLGANAVSVRADMLASRDLPELAAARRSRAVGFLQGDLRVVAALFHARAIGLSTILSPSLRETSSGSWSGRLQWGGRDHWQVFFDNYDRFVMHAGLLAELAGVEILSLGSVLAETARSRSDWDDTVQAWKREGWPKVIATARKAFDGGLTYNASWPDEVREIEFWHLLDYVSVCVFKSVRDLERPHERPSDAAVLLNLSSALYDAADAGREEDKPVIVAEIGFTSTDDAWNDVSFGGGRTNSSEQARLFRLLGQAVAEVSAERPELRGLLVWSWSTRNQAGGASDRGFTPQNKPAEMIIRGCFREL